MATARQAARPAQLSQHVRMLYVPASNAVAPDYQMDNAQLLALMCCHVRTCNRTFACTLASMHACEHACPTVFLTHAVRALSGAYVLKCTHVCAHVRAFTPTATLRLATTNPPSLFFAVDCRTNLGLCALSLVQHIPPKSTTQICLVVQNAAPRQFQACLL